MKVGDLVIRKYGASIIRNMKGIILQINEDDQGTRYKIVWLNYSQSQICDRWQRHEFVAIDHGK